MLAVLKAINLLLRRTNALKQRFSTGTLPSFKSLDPIFLNVLRIPRPWTGLGRTIKTIVAIEKVVVIVALMAQDLQALPQPPESTQLILFLGMIEIATGHRSRRTKTWFKLLVTIIIRKGILLTSALSPTSKKTSISFGNLHVGDWC